MKVVIAIDSFKGSLSSLQAGTAAATGIYRVDPKVETVVRPLADGGEGTVQALTEGLGGRLVSVSVTGPAGKQVICPYGIIDRTQTAIIEMSGAAGITQVHGDEKNPLYATTYGVGEVICDAIRNGCHRFIIGIGGSATNDGGIGMLQALGFGLLDAEGKQVPFGAVGLESLTTITADHVLPELSECTFRIACDVTNPLCGSNGCSAVFGPQKGADAVMIKRMDTSLASYAALCRKTFPNVDAEIFVFNNRINYFPIFHEEAYSFGEMQVVPMIDQYFKKEEILNRIYVYDDGIIRGFTEINGTEICKLYVDPCLQNNGVGHGLITFAIEKFDADHLWALEKNTRAIAFYNRHGFRWTGTKQLEAGTTEYLLELRR